MNDEFESVCCHAEMFTSWGQEGTNCYICTACHQPCDPKLKAERPRSNWIHQLTLAAKALLHL